MKGSEVSAEVSREPAEVREKKGLEALIKSVQEGAQTRREVPDMTDDRLRDRLEARSDAKESSSDDVRADNVLTRILSERSEKMKETKDPDSFSEEVQTRELATCLGSMEEIRYEKWKELSPAERLDVLQRIENEAARIGGRPAFEVSAVEMPEGCRGAANWQRKYIHLNRKLIASNRPEDLRQTLKTLVHEGRHVYQNSNIFLKRVEPNDEKWQAWRENLCSEGGYFTAEKHGYRLYYTQPVEVDARVFSEGVISRARL